MPNILKTCYRSIKALILSKDDREVALRALAEVGFTKPVQAILLAYLDRELVATREKLDMLKSKALALRSEKKY
ncbi:MAG: hypothetical protein QMD65_02785 [Patescibacteria group bacterium]|nr:hypothetical protein [Patescibacteria group bacterium]